MLMLTIVFMAVTSAGSAEMMAVSSLCTYDVYKVRAPAPASLFRRHSNAVRGPTEVSFSIF